MSEPKAGALCFALPSKAPGLRGRPASVWKGPQRPPTLALSRAGIPARAFFCRARSACPRAPPRNRQGLESMEGTLGISHGGWSLLLAVKQMPTPHPNTAFKKEGTFDTFMRIIGPGRGRKQQVCARTSCERQSQLCL